jgi:hypothetical protein
MPAVDIAEFEEKMVTFLASGETVFIQRDGALIGYFVSLKQENPATVAAWLEEPDAPSNEAF